jgi:hypothetical protein
MRAGACLQGCGDFTDGGGWQREPVRILAVLISLPSELFDHAGEDSIGLAHMPCVMEPPDDEVVVADVGEFLLLDRIACERSLIVEMVIESGLVGDDEVFVAGYCLFED